MFVCLCVCMFLYAYLLDWMCSSFDFVCYTIKVVLKRSKQWYIFENLQFSGTISVLSRRGLVPYLQDNLFSFDVFSVIDLKKSSV